MELPVSTDAFASMIRRDANLPHQASRVEGFNGILLGHLTDIWEVAAVKVATRNPCRYKALVWPCTSHRNLI